MVRKKAFVILGLILGIPFLAIQAVPYGHDHANPPVRTQPNWGSQEVHDIALRACYDCHSNE